MSDYLQNTLLYFIHAGMSRAADFADVLRALAAECPLSLSARPAEGANGCTGILAAMSMPHVVDPNDNETDHASWKHGWRRPAQSPGALDSLISVIIPCYNQGRFLGDAVESVLRQTHRPLEIIVVNDGSSDDTAEVAARYPNVRHVWQANAGLSAARNTGLRHSAGAYLVFLDADDRLLPSALEVGLACLRQHSECAFVSGRHVFIGEDGTRLEVPNSHGPITPAKCGHFSALLQRNYIGMHGTVMYRRSVLVAIGGFDETLTACEDYDVYLRLARRYPVASHDHIVAEYRRHPSSMSGDASRMLAMSLKVLRSQAKAIGAHRQLRRAYIAGIDYYVLHYGYALTRQLIAEAQTRGYRWKALKGFAAMLQNASLYLVVSALIRRTAKGGYLKLRPALPQPVGRRLDQLLWRLTHQKIGTVEFGALRRLTPISTTYGFDRGTPVDRHYIEHFLAQHTAEIRGRVMEIGDDTYTRRFGGERVIQSDVLHVKEGNAKATFVADLPTAHHIPSNTFDCVILTQTLHLIYDFRAAMATLHRILKPGGTLLGTVPGVSQIEAGEWRDTWYWSFTTTSMRRLLSEFFPAPNFEVESFGNVLTSISLLQGIATEELTETEFDYHDRRYQLVVAFRALKPAEP